jgi:hypothetical protein
MKRIKRSLFTAMALIGSMLSAGIPPVQAAVQKPDLVCESFTITYSPVTGLYTLTVGIHNYGPGDAGACTLKMVRWTPTTILGRPGARGATYTKSVPIINAYCSYSLITFNLGSADPGDDWADFTVDSNNVINETNETNNTQRVYFW